MIKNEKQLKITKSNIKKFQEALQLLSKDVQDENSSLLYQLKIDSIKSQIEEMKDEVYDYEKLKAGKVNRLVANFQNIGEILIRGRLARGLNHKGMGKLLGVSQQQIQKYESENYGKASIEKVQKICEILDVNVSTVASLKGNDPYGKQKFYLPTGIDTELAEQKLRSRNAALNM